MINQPSQLHIHLLGSPDVRFGDRVLAFPTRKTLALLAYLALEAGPQPRQHLSALLYPESSPERSYASLRNTLGHLQTALRLAGGQEPLASLIITHDALELNVDAGIDFDLQTVAQAYALARADRSSRMPPEVSASLPLLQAAAACQRGDFLVGFSLGSAPEFDDWVDMQREVWRRRMGLILDRLSEIQFAGGEFSNATETAARWIALDTLNEIAYRMKMRAHFAAGERGLAVDTYEACRALLASELEVEPEPDTEALAAHIRSQYPHPHTAPRADTPVAFLEDMFAGRTAEQQSLIECYRRAASGQPQVVVLRGEAGIGKTRLAKEFVTWTRAQGTELLQGDSFESSSHMPFQPLLDAFRMRFEQEETQPDWLGETWLDPFIHLLPDLVQRYPRLPLTHLENTAQPMETGQALLFEQFVRLSLALANRAPLVLFVDDMQWADSATLDFLLYATRRWQKKAAQSDRGARILLLASLRSEALHPAAQFQFASGPRGLSEWMADVERELVPFHIELKPLGEQDTIQMILSILSPPAVDFAQWLFDETRGQPFYLIETLKDLLERRVLHPRRQAAGKWAFEVDARHDLGQAVRVPSTVRAVIRSRLDRLSPNGFTMLAAAAVLEQRITFQRLCGISNLSEDLGLPALDELLSGRLLIEAALAGTASAYSFANDMIRDVVYTEAGDARRRLFHRRVLEILESARDYPANLAHHSLAAGLTEPAFRHSLAAGREALRLSVAGEAIVHYEQARRLVLDTSLPEPPAETDLRDLYSQLGRAYELLGHTEKAISVYEELEHVVKKK